MTINRWNWSQPATLEKILIERRLMGNMLFTAVMIRIPLPCYDLVSTLSFRIYLAAFFKALLRLLSNSIISRAALTRFSRASEEIWIVS